MTKILRYISFILLTVGLSTPAAAKKSTLDLKGHPSVGLNALDYKLQKPLGNDTFPTEAKGISKHFFIGAGIGIGSQTETVSLPRPGMNFTGRVGTWFTPVFGARVVAKAGVTSLHTSEQTYTWFGGFQADLLVDMTTLLRGYNPNRKFGLISTLGVEGGALRYYGTLGKQFGAGASLQARYNIGNSLYLFAEPRIAVLAGTRFGGFEHHPYRMKINPTVSVGLGYRIITGEERRLEASDFNQTKDDNLYFGAGIGGWTGLHYATRIHFGGSAYAGKMFSSTSGLQFTAALGHKGGNHVTERERVFTIGTLDYVLNIDNATSGYHPNRVFNLLANIGGGAGFVLVHNGSRDVTPVFSAGLTGLFRISPNWALTIHPQVYLSTTKFFENLNIRRPMLATVDLGLRYSIGDFSNRFPDSYETLANSNRWFFTAGAGIAHRTRFDYGLGTDIFIGIGKRFTPVSSYRIMAAGSAFPRRPVATNFTFHFDYLSSLTNAMCGYDPTRFFELQFVLGMFTGAAEYDGPLNFTIGGKTGLQGNFRINESLDLYVEPLLLAAIQPQEYQRNLVPELRLNAGIRYRLGNPSYPRGHISETPYGDKRNFAGFAVGPSAYFSASNRSAIHMCAALDFYAGRWFSMVSGARLVYSDDFNGNNIDETTYVGALRADYLINISSLMDRRSERRFHVIGAIGAGIAFNKNGRNRVVPEAYAGFQFRYNLPWNIDVHAEAAMEAWQRAILPDFVQSNTHSAVFCPRLLFGASYRF